MDHRVTITYDGLLGADNADRLMDALVVRADHAGPVISEDLGAGTFSITLAISAHTLQDALAIANTTGRDTLHTAHLERTAVAAEVELVDAPDRAAA